MAGKGRPESKISPALARALGAGDGGYELSSAFSEPELRRFMGEWEVVDHRVEGKPYLERFKAKTVKALRLEDAAYLARYSFKDGICVKRVGIDGTLDLPDGEVAYSYRMGVALSWSILPGGFLKVKPELGYQSSFLGGQPAAAAELSTAGESDIVIRYHFEADGLVLEEGSDVKRLRRPE